MSGRLTPEDPPSVAPREGGSSRASSGAFRRDYSHWTENSSSALPGDWPTTQELVASRQPRSRAWMPLEREIRELVTLPSAEKTTSTTAVWGAGQVTWRRERSTGQRP